MLSLVIVHFHIVRDPGCFRAMRTPRVRPHSTGIISSGYPPKGGNLGYATIVCCRIGVMLFCHFRSPATTTNYVFFRLSAQLPQQKHPLCNSFQPTKPHL